MPPKARKAKTSAKSGKVPSPVPPPLPPPTPATASPFLPEAIPVKTYDFLDMLAEDPSASSTAPHAPEVSL
jgi:hypothetical protein